MVIKMAGYLFAQAAQLDAPRVYDCAGLVKSYWMQETPTAPPRYIAAKDKSANGLYQCCTANGKIETLPKDTPGALVFIWDSSRRCMRYVGVHDGARRIIEAQGVSALVLSKGPSQRVPGRTGASWIGWNIRSKKQEILAAWRRVIACA